MGKVLIIGGSKGIGAATIELLRNDHEVINFSRTEPENTEGIEHHKIDILSDDLPEIEELDALVYCPGSINLKPFKNLSVEDYQNDFDINVLGAVKALKKYEKPLKSSGKGSIILFSTVAVGQGMPFHTSISASKGAIEGIVRSLGAEFAPTVRVNGIAPTVTDTQLSSRILRNEKARERVKERHPLQSIIQPEEIANTAKFLLSDAAKNIIGQIIGVDAGLSSLNLK